MYRFRIFFNSINPISEVYSVASLYLKKKAIREFIKFYKIKSYDYRLLEIKKITESEFFEENIWNSFKGGFK